MKGVIVFLSIFFVSNLTNTETQESIMEDIFKEVLLPEAPNIEKLDEIRQLEWRLLEIGDIIEPYDLVVTSKRSTVILGKSNEDYHFEAVTIPQRAIYLVSDKDLRHLPDKERSLIAKSIKGDAIVSKDKEAIKQLISKGVLREGIRKITHVSDLEKIKDTFLGADVLKDAIADSDMERLNEFGNLNWNYLKIGDTVEPYDLIVTSKSAAVILGRNEKDHEIDDIGISARTIFLVSGRRVECFPGDERFLMVKKLKGDAIVSKDKEVIKELISKGIIKAPFSMVGIISESKKKIIPFLGISNAPLPQNELEIKVGGVKVRTIIKDSPAEKAGIIKGDVITSFDGRIIENFKQLQEEVAKTKDGQEVLLGILRDGKKKGIWVQMKMREIYLAPTVQEILGEATHRPK